MRSTNLLPLAVALATAIVIPDDATARELGLRIETPADNAEKIDTAWWDTLRSTAQKHHLKSHADETISHWWDILRSRLDETLETIDHAKQHVEELFDDATSDGIDLLGADELGDEDDEDDEVTKPPHHRRPHHPHHPHRPNHPRTTNLTIYEILQASNYSKKFAAMIADFPDMVDLLNSTETNVTVFVPIDKAFDRIPDGVKKPPKEVIEKIMRYHIVPGFYPARRVFASHTLPTALNHSALGERPQRLRVGVGLTGLRLNFHSHAVGLDLFAKNGMMHAVDGILVPPPPVRHLISLFPSKFSTLELAATKTGLLSPDDKKLHRGHNLTGLTVFAPTNAAFARLGPAANAFLFNTEKGLGYLRALLKYHIVVNETLYSDAYYGLQKTDIDHVPAKTETDTGGERNNRHFHIDLPTLLGDKSLSIDISRWLRFINIRINGYRDVALQDALAFDGVMQVVNGILIPPHQHKRGPPEFGPWDDEVEGYGEISVEELVERLGPYVEEEKAKEEKPKDASPAEDQAWGEL